jgi:DNA-binding response OmpR family regulator
MQTILALDGSRTGKLWSHSLRSAGFRVRVLDSIQEHRSAYSDATCAVLIRFQDERDFARAACLEVRRTAPHVPLIIISPEIDVATKVCLLDLGADDYVEEPFAAEELIARVRSVIRARQSIS